MESIAIGLLGAGEVSLRLVQALTASREQLALRLGARVDLVALHPGDAPAPLQLPEYCRVVDDPYEIVEDAAVAVLVDCGGVADSLDINSQALERGKDLVSANVALVAAHGRALVERACECQRVVAIGGVLGDMAPLMRQVEELGLGSTVHRLAFVPGRADQMRGGEGAGGADSTAVDPLSSRFALAASEAFGQWIEGASVVARRDATPEELEYVYAEKVRASIQTVCLAESRPDGVALLIEPMMLLDPLPLMQVGADSSCGLVKMGSGERRVVESAAAGADAVAHALLMDLAAAAQRALLEPTGWSASWPLAEAVGRSSNVLVEDQLTTPCYLRFEVNQEPGVIARLTGSLGDHGVPIAHLESPAPDPSDPRARTVIITTGPSLWRNVRLALEKLNKMPATRAPARSIRVLSTS